MYTNTSFDQLVPSLNWTDIGSEAFGVDRDRTRVVLDLLQNSLHQTLSENFGPETAAAIFQKSGRRAGAAFCRESLRRDLSFPEFIARLQKQWADLGIGVLRFEQANAERLRFQISISSGMGTDGQPACHAGGAAYEHGFLAGILEAYTGRKFRVREVARRDTQTRTIAIEALEEIFR